VADNTQKLDQIERVATATTRIRNTEYVESARSVCIAQIFTRSARFKPDERARSLDRLFCLRKVPAASQAVGREFDVRRIGTATSSGTAAEVLCIVRRRRLSGSTSSANLSHCSRASAPCGTIEWRLSFLSAWSARPTPPAAKPCMHASSLLHCSSHSRPEPPPLPPLPTHTSLFSPANIRSTMILPMLSLALDEL
jgi:hypothetical protein